MGSLPTGPGEKSELRLRQREPLPPAPNPDSGQQSPVHSGRQAASSSQVPLAGRCWPGSAAHGCAGSPPPTPWLSVWDAVSPVRAQREAETQRLAATRPPREHMFTKTKAHNPFKQNLSWKGPSDLKTEPDPIYPAPKSRLPGRVKKPRHVQRWVNWEPPVVQALTSQEERPTTPHFGSLLPAGWGRGGGQHTSSQMEPAAKTPRTAPR